MDYYQSLHTAGETGLSNFDFKLFQRRMVVDTKTPPRLVPANYGADSYNADSLSLGIAAVTQPTPPSSHSGLVPNSI